MEKLIKKLSNLSAIELSDTDIKKFSHDFCDILPLLDTISNFPIFENSIIKSENFETLRSDIPNKSTKNHKTNTVPRIIQ